MQLLFGIQGLRQLPPAAVVSIGNFDGVHWGHRSIVAMVQRLAGEAPGRAVAAVTFEPHPVTVLRPEAAPPRLTPVGVKRELLAALGIQFLVELPPEPAVLNLSAEDFWRILRDEVRPSHIVEGDSFNFGKGRGGNVRQLQKWAVGSGIGVHIGTAAEVGLLDMQRVPVSSSLVRFLLAHGRVRDAAICLGRAYELRGPVIVGHQRGRTIGIPTANLDCSAQLVPADGVYVGRCRVDGRVWPAAVSIGPMPTFGDNRRQVEAHLVGYEGDLYGREIGVELVDWLREQRKFDGVESLKTQLGRDIEWTVSRSALDPARPIARMA
ncbi:MAG: bifunctional riboflavin kinase/FMN adenylyltransferase [Tepidisphaerales bacterium]